MNLQQLRLAEWFADCSLGQGVATVRVIEKRELAEALWMGKKEIGQTIDELIELRVIKAVGETEWEMVTDTAFWKVQWRWRTAQDRESGKRRQAMMLRDQHHALVLEDRGLDGVERRWNGNVNAGNALLPSSRGNAESPAFNGDVIELRARIAESLRSTDAVGESPTHAGGEEASGRLAHQKTQYEQSQCVNRQLESEFHPSVPVGDSPTEPRASARASSGTIGSMATAIQSIQCGEVATRPNGKWSVDEDLMRRLRLVVGEKNAGYWWKVMKDDGFHGARAAREALAEWQLRRGPPPGDPSRYLFGIYRRFFKQFSAIANT